MATPLPAIEGMALFAGLGSSVLSGLVSLTKLGASAGINGADLTAPLTAPLGMGQNLPPEPMAAFTGAGSETNPLAALFTAPSKLMSDISVQTSKLLSPIQSMNSAFANTISSAFSAFTPQINIPTPQGSSPPAQGSSYNV